MEERLRDEVFGVESRRICFSIDLKMCIDEVEEERKRGDEEEEEQVRSG